MAYTAEISRTNPTCFLFLVDQSGSMAERFGAEVGQEQGRRRRRGRQSPLADARGPLRQRGAHPRPLLRRGDRLRRRGLPGVSHRRPGGRACSNRSAGSAPTRSASKTASSGGATAPADCDEQHVKFPVWFEPRAQGKTPMCAAFRAARDVLSGFIGRYPGCFPPIVINISDGAATDGAFEPEALAIWRLASRGRQRPAVQHPPLRAGREADPVPQRRSAICPTTTRGGCSACPARCRPPCSARPGSWKRRSTEGARGFAFNADLASVVMFLDIGTRVGDISRAC